MKKILSTVMLLGLSENLALGANMADTRGKVGSKLIFNCNNESDTTIVNKFSLKERSNDLVVSTCLVASFLISIWLRQVVRNIREQNVKIDKDLKDIQFQLSRLKNNMRPFEVIFPEFDAVWCSLIEKRGLSRELMEHHAPYGSFLFRHCYKSNVRSEKELLVGMKNSLNYLNKRIEEINAIFDRFVFLDENKFRWLKNKLFVSRIFYRLFDRVISNSINKVGKKATILRIGASKIRGELEKQIKEAPAFILSRSISEIFTDH